MRTILIVLLATVLIIGCGDVNRNITTSYHCIEELPSNIVGTYVLRKMIIGTKAEVDRIILSPSKIVGRLILGNDQSFLMRTRQHGVKQELKGYFDVIAGFMFVYVNSGFEDVGLAFQYRHMGHRAIILEWYNPLIEKRTIFYWTRLPTSFYPE